MSKADDVSTLFRRFGGDASTYQEVVAEQQVESAMSRWPMLDQISPRLRPASPVGVVHLPVIGARTHHAVPDVVVSGGAVARPVASLPLVQEPPVGTSHAVERTSVAPAAPVAPAPVVLQTAPAAVPSQEPKMLAKLFADVVPEAVAQTHVAEKSDLKTMFRRMVPNKVAPAHVAADSGLKRLAKW